MCAGGRGVVCDGFPGRRISLYDISAAEEWPETHGVAAMEMLDEALTTHGSRPKATANATPVKFGAPKGMVSQTDVAARGSTGTHMCALGHLLALVPRMQSGAQAAGGCVLRANFAA